MKIAIGVTFPGPDLLPPSDPSDCLSFPFGSSNAFLPQLQSVPTPTLSSPHLRTSFWSCFGCAVLLFLQFPHSWLFDLVCEPRCQSWFEWFSVFRFCRVRFRCSQLSVASLIPGSPNFYIFTVQSVRSPTESTSQLPSSQLPKRNAESCCSNSPTSIQWSQFWAFSLLHSEIRWSFALYEWCLRTLIDFRHKLCCSATDQLLSNTIVTLESWPSVSSKKRFPYSLSEWADSSDCRSSSQSLSLETRFLRHRFSCIGNDNCLLPRKCRNPSHWTDLLHCKNLALRLYTAAHAYCAKTKSLSNLF